MPRPAAAVRSVFEVDFDTTPFTVAWEITRACALACAHCRAEAIPRRDPRELSTAEAFAVVDQIVAIGKPILVVTGGDPLMRRDVFDILAYAVGQGLRVGFSPSVTRLLTRAAIERIHDIGVAMVHISLDGSSAAVHDTFRGVNGSFQRTLAVMHDLQQVGLPLQIGTTVSRHNRADLPAIARVVQGIGASVWSVFFLVPTGRAQAAWLLSAGEHEAVLTWLAKLSESGSFRVRTTEAPHYRRVLIQRLHAASAAARSAAALALVGAGYAFHEGRAPAGRGVNDGSGFCFISHVGDVYPSGFLPLSAGNVRQRSLASIYRETPLFHSLRDPMQLQGKCGRCEFKVICGGSRARAYALTGNYLAEEPCCIYEPA